MKTISHLGEFGLIRRFRARLPKGPSSVRIGPGDDCAVVRLPGRAPLLLLTTDMLIEGVHFRRDWTALEKIGAKAMAVNLSDIAAMGGVPRFALVSIGLPPSLPLRDADRLFRGLRRVACQNGVLIVGGDTNASKCLVVNVALVGYASGSRVLTRAGARVGDLLYVTGTLGEAALGLAALQRNVEKGFRHFIRRHECPPIRLAVGRRLARIRGVHSLIDLSDGLVGDLGHILEESGVGAEVVVDHLPVGSALRGKARRLGLDPTRLALAGGEDYELLFTASPRAVIPRQIGGVAVTRIGRILPRRAGLRKPCSSFRHF